MVTDTRLTHIKQHYTLLQQWEHHSFHHKNNGEPWKPRSCCNPALPPQVPSNQSVPRRKYFPFKWGESRSKVRVQLPLSAIKSISRCLPRDSYKLSGKDRLICVLPFINNEASENVRGVMKHDMTYIHHAGKQPQAHMHGEGNTTLRSDSILFGHH